MRMSRPRFRIFLTACMLLSVCAGHAQTRPVTLSGLVRSAEDGESLPGAYVILTGMQGRHDTQGCITNTAGFYSITVPAGTYRLNVKYISYKDFDDTVVLDKNVSLDFDLEAAVFTADAVVIQGERGDRNVTNADVGRMEMKIEAVRNLPALMGEADVLKSIQLLPGVQSGGEGNTGFYVRGGGTDQNLILLDDATVYNAGHLLGFFSVFNGNAVKSVEMVKSGMPAYYGGRAASILNVSQKDGNMKKYGAEGGIGLIFSNLTVQGPFKKDKASFIISGRRTYIDVLMQPLLKKKDSPLKGTDFYFYDLNAKFNIVLNEKNRLYFGVYYGKDAYGFNSQSGQTRTAFDWANAMASIRWNSILTPQLFLNTSFAFSHYDFGADMGLDVYKFKMRSGVQDYSVKSELSWIPSPKHNVRFGVHNITHVCFPGRYEAEAGAGFNFNMPEEQPYTGNEFSLYAHDEWEATRRLKLNMGLRYTNFSHLGRFTRYILDSFGHVADSVTYRPGEAVSHYNRVEPRLAARLLIDSMTSIKLSATLNHQFMHQIALASISLPTDVWMPCTDLIRPQTVMQFSLGAFRNFRQNMFETYIDLYYKKMWHLAEYRDGLDFGSLTVNPDQQYVFGQGYSWGAEFFIKKSRGRFSGFIGYTLSFTKRQFDCLNGGKPFWAKYDRRHDVSVNLSYDIIPRRLKVSALWVYATGNTMTIPVAMYFYMGSIVTEFSERNGYRMAPYHRLDLALDWTIFKGPKFETGLNLSVYNVYNRKNPFFIFFETTSRFNVNTMDFNIRTQAYQMSLFPILPSVTWNFKF